MARRKQEVVQSAELPEDVSGLRGWKPARHVADLSTTKVPTRRITINLDQDIVAIFKAEALQGGPPYQMAINQALRTFLREREAGDQQRAVEAILGALDEAAVRRKLRQVLKLDSAA